jgi:hypothetical protein
MDLESLKAAMEEALKAHQAASTDKALEQAYAVAKKAYEDALAAAEADPDPATTTTPVVDESKLDETTKAYLAKLRKENAGHRTKNKELVSKLSTSEDQKKKILEAAGITVDTETPEEKLKSISAESQQLAFRSAILESAVQNGISKDGLDYFEFLVAKEVQGLAEDEELADEKMAEIVAKVKKSAGGGSANTTVGTGGKGGNPPPPVTDPGEVTLEQFVRMSITEKSALYMKNVDQYEKLYKAAKSQKKLV